MNEYTIYFELYGKKLKTTILAKSEEDAKKMILSKIVFHKIVKENNKTFNQSKDVFNNIMDILNLKK
jgi:cytochrome c biogenesis protein ResB